MALLRSLDCSVVVTVITLCAGEAAAQCIVIAPVCVFVCLPRKLEIACIDPH